jgi:hypothetical protein
MKPKIYADWTIYLLLYAWISLSSLADLLHPQGVKFGYYAALVAFHRTSLAWNALAILSAGLAVVSLWPVMVRAFSLHRSAQNFFKLILFVRIAADIGGHNYETLFLKPLWADKSITAALVILLAVSLHFPSYKALFDHAFDRKRKMPRPS